MLFCMYDIADYVLSWDTILIKGYCNDKHWTMSIYSQPYGAIKCTNSYQYDCGMIKGYSPICLTCTDYELTVDIDFND